MNIGKKVRSNDQNRFGHEALHLPSILASWQGDGHTLELTESFEPYDQSVLTKGWVSEKTPGQTKMDILALLRSDGCLAFPQLV